MSRFSKAQEFCERFGLKLPILLAPMAGVTAPPLSIAVQNAGGMGSLGALLMQPSEILAWAQEVRTASSGPFQLNLWIPDPAPQRDMAHELLLRNFLGEWGPQVPASAGDAAPPDFAAQCEALLEAKPAAISSVMGLYPAQFVKRMKAEGIHWFAIVTTVAEAKQAEAAGADVIIAQGMEAGGHRGAFKAENAERDLVGLFALLPALTNAVKVPVVATGGIADGRGVAAALALGASAVQIGTGFMRCPEARLPTAWADAISQTMPEQTVLTRAFSGRAGRSIATAYVKAAAANEAPAPAPYPVQRAFTAQMRAQAIQMNDETRIQAWAGQSAALASAMPAQPLTTQIWAEAYQILGLE